jgi:hypothetical protein
MVQPDRYAAVNLNGDLMGLLAFGIPNTIIAGVFLYMLAVIFRSNLISFVGAMLMLVLYALSGKFTADIQKEWLANILDPFGFRPFNIVAKYMTVDEKNTSAVPLAGALLTNRIIWLIAGLLILVAGYFRFSFSLRNTRFKKEKKKQEKAKPAYEEHYEPAQAAGRFGLQTLWFLTKFETKTIIRNPTFIIILIIGIINLIAALTTVTGIFGLKQYPVTYHIISGIQGLFYLFLIGIITFYSGVVVWKERDAKMNEIQDATPVPTSFLFLSKLFSMIAVIAFVLISTIVIGILTQAAYGYFNFQLALYIKSLLVIDLLAFTYLVVIALFFHYVINNRYIAYFAFIAFVILNLFIWQAFDVSTNLVKYGVTPTAIYSDMNGFGPFVAASTWFNVYWTLAAAILCFVIIFFYVRGKELRFRHRLTTARRLAVKYRLPLGFTIVAFIFCTGFVYYNTEILNEVESPDQQEKNQVDYEKQFKKYENLVQPRFYSFNYTIDLMPENRSYNAKAEAWARNISTSPINELHFTMPQLPDTVSIDIPGAKVKLNDKRLNYRIYQLDKPLMPNDSLRMIMQSSLHAKGFENEVSFNQLTDNGTFFNNSDILPSFGYNGNYEIGDKNKRVKLKLPPRNRMPKLNEADILTRSNNYISNDADWVEVNTVISTSPDQTAIAPGSLVRTWEQNSRKYFQYKLDNRSLNFYSFLSARYEVAKEKWKGVDLEVYYHKQHAVNVPNMLKGMKQSLEYYTKNFGPYYHKQCRIIEFPRYATFAQSFPGTMPYSEGVGFIADLRNVTKNDIDEVFYIVAHEMAHQYWAHQLIGAKMQGSEMMAEGFSQYSALMVMEKEYGKDKMKKFLKYEMDQYLSGRSEEPIAEQPLMKTEQQQYIHYNKASVALYYLKEMIGEDKVNEAMRSLIDSFAYKPPPYATSIAAVNAFRKVAPSHLQYLIDDLFENITIFSNRTLSANYKKVGNEYEVTIKTLSEKFRADSLGKEKNIPLADYIDVGVFAVSDNKENLGKPLVLQRVKLTTKDNVFTFKVKEKPGQAGIDPL